MPLLPGLKENSLNGGNVLKIWPEASYRTISVFCVWCAHVCAGMDKHVWCMFRPEVDVERFPIMFTLFIFLKEFPSLLKQTVIYLSVHVCGQTRATCAVCTWK